MVFGLWGGPVHQSRHAEITLTIHYHHIYCMIVNIVKEVYGVLWSIYSYIQAYILEKRSPAAEKNGVLLHGALIIGSNDTKHEAFQNVLRSLAGLRWARVLGDIWPYSDLFKDCRHTVNTPVHDMMCFLCGYEHLRAEYASLRAWSGLNIVKQLQIVVFSNKLFHVITQLKSSTWLQNICRWRSYVRVVSRGFINRAEDQPHDSAAFSNRPLSVTVLIRKCDLITNYNTTYAV